MQIQFLPKNFSKTKKSSITIIVTLRVYKLSQIKRILTSSGGMSLEMMAHDDIGHLVSCNLHFTDQKLFLMTSVLPPVVKKPLITCILSIYTKQKIIVRITCGNIT